MAQFSYPISDITNPANWNGDYTDIDEGATIDDNDYGWSNDKDTLTYEAKLGSVTDPVSGASHQLNYRIASMDGGVGPDGGGNIPAVTVHLYQGTTLIASDISRDGYGAWQTYAIYLTATEANNITDYSDLRIRLNVIGSGGSPANRRGIGLSWCEFECPDVPPSPITVTSDGVATVTGVLTAKGELQGKINSNEIEQLDEDGSLNIKDGGTIAASETVIWNHNVGEVQFKLLKVGSPVVDIVCKIYSSSSGLPNALLQTSSNVIASSSLTTGLTWQTFIFDGSTVYSQEIVIVCEYQNVTTFDASNYFAIGMYSLNTDYNGRMATDNGGWLLSSSWWDLAFKIKAKSVSATISQIVSIKGRSDSNRIALLESDTANSIYIGGIRERLGQALLNYNNNVNSIKFLLYKAGSPVHDIKAVIYSLSGGLPNSVLQTSTNVIAASSLTIGTSGLWYEFLFDGTTNYSQDIAVVIELTNVTTSNSSNRIIAHEKYDVLESLVGKELRYNGTIWSDYDGFDLSLDVTAKSVSGDLTVSVLDDLIGSSDGVATLTGVLTAKGALVGDINMESGVGIIDSYAFSNQNSGEELGLVFEANQSFTGNGEKLTKAKFYIKDGTTPPTAGSIYCYLFAHTGAYGTSSEPTGVALATATSIAASTMTGAYVEYEFDFLTPYTVLNGVNYVIQVYFNGISTEEIAVAKDTSSPTHDGNFADQFSPYSGQDLIFSLEYDRASEIIVEGILTSKGKLEGASDCTPQTIFEETTQNASWAVTDTLDRIGQQFIGFNDSIYQFKVWINKVGPGSTFDIRCEIYSKSGADPNSVLQISPTIINETQLTASYQEITFEFDGTVYNEDIFILCRIENETASGGNSPQFNYDNANTVTGQTRTWKYSGAYTHEATESMRYQLISNLGVNLQATIAAKGSLESEITTVPTTAGILTAKGNLKGQVDAGSYTLIKQLIHTNIWSADSNEHIFGQKVGVITGRIHSIQFLMRKKGNPTYNIEFSIVDIVGGDPTNQLEFVNFDSSDLSLEWEWITVYFTSTYYNEDLYIAAKRDDPLDSSNYFEIGYVIGSQIAGEVVIHNSVTWDSYPTWDATFKLALEDVSGDLTEVASEDLIGSSDGVATVDGILTAKGELIGSIDISLTNNGILTAKGALEGSIDISITNQGVLIALGSLIGSIDISLTNEGILIAKGSLETDITTVPTTEGILTGRGALAGASDGATTTTSVLTNGVSIGDLVGESNGIATIAGILTASGKLIGASNPALTVTGTLQARGSLEVEITAVAALTGILTANGELIGSSDPSITVEGVLTAKGTLVSSIDAIATTAGILTAKGTLESSITSTTTTSGTLSIIGIVSSITTTTGTLTAKGSLVGESNGIATTIGTLSIIGGINTITTTSGTLSAKGSLIGSIDISITNNGVLNAKGSLIGEINISLTNNGVLSAKGALESSSDGIATVSGELTAIGSLSGSSDGLATTEGIMISNFLFGTINSVTSTSGVLTAKGSLIGEITINITNNGQLTSKGDLDSSIDAIVTVTGVLTAKGNLIGIINAEAIIPLAELTGVGQLLGIITALAFIPLAELTAKGSLIGESTPSITIQGILIGKGILAGSSNGVATTIAVLGLQLKGSVDGLATTSGVLIAKGSLESIVNNVATTQGVLTAKGSLIGASDGVASQVSVLSQRIAISSSSDGIATTSGTLIAKGSSIGVITTITTTTGVLTAKGSLVGIVNSVTTTLGVLVADTIVEGAINSITTISGVLTGKGLLSGASNAIASTSGSLIAKGSLESIANNVATTQGILTGKGSLAGSSDGSTSTTGILISDAVAGIVSGIATTQGTLTAKGALLGISDGLTTTLSDLKGRGALVSLVSSISSVDGTLSGLTEIDESIDGIATVIGTLLATGSLSGESNGATIIGLTYTPSEELIGISNGVATVTGLLKSLQDLDTREFYKVKYYTPGLYIVHYLTPKNIIRYLYKNYVVNYQSQKNINKNHYE